MGTKRNRRTQEEMLAHYQAQVEKLQAKIDGSYQDENENNVLKALKKRLRKTETALRSAGLVVNGVQAEDGMGWTRAPQAVKIAKTEKRLEDQRETLYRAEALVTALPFDVERLKALINASGIGDIVEFPTDLTPLEAPKTDEEHETAFIASEEGEQQEA
ncbi:MAG: hypothetical protein ACYSTI_13030 [Planctomycetota bacterium]|jgi:hypothetical protein